MDIAAPAGTPIVAVADGDVVRTYDDPAGGLGIGLDIQHTDPDAGNFLARYGHMGRREVGCGAGVRKGEVIGYVGSTGHSTEPHLHLAFRQDGAWIDPAQYLSG